MPKAKVGQKRKQDAQPSTSKVANVKSEKQDEPIEKVVKFSGKVPVDEGFPYYANGPFHVYEEHSLIYNAMLNQTNIGQNNNKYYIIQLVKHNKANIFATLCKWGRVGKIAGSSTDEFHDVDNAKKMFNKKFSAKTGNDWSFAKQGPGFVKRKGKYDLVDVDYGKEDEVKVVKKSGLDIASTLPNKVQELIQLIFNKEEWEAAVKEMKFDVKKAPLGKLTKNQVKTGYASLKKIEECLKSKKINEKKLEEACSEFFTRIPHDFGMKKPPLIRTTEEIKEKMELLEALDDIQIGVSIMKESADEQNLNLLDVYYKSLKCEINPLDKSNGDYKVVKEFIKNTHANLHKHFKLNIEEIFQVHREADDQRFKKDLGNRMLLWHGSRLTNWCGILKQGLRIAPPEAPVTGYMFGKGVYFADIVSKSAQYCYTSTRQPTGLMLICEVALGGVNEKTSADYEASALPKGKHCTKGLGRQEPDKRKQHVMSNGAVVPLGKLKDTKVTGSHLRFNEYIVYDVAQINPRYLVRLKFDHVGYMW